MRCLLPLVGSYGNVVIHVFSMMSLATLIYNSCVIINFAKELVAAKDVVGNGATHKPPRLWKWIGWNPPPYGWFKPNIMPLSRVILEELQQATSWKLEEALQLFYVGNEAGPVASVSHSPPTENANTWADENTGGLKGQENETVNVGQDGGEENIEVGYPPNETSSLVAFRNFDEEMRRPGVWESDQGATSTAENPRDNLASSYFIGNSGMLKYRQKVYDDTSEGRKVCTYYKLDSIPVVLVIDPITGQKMRAWSGMIQPESLLED
ncbi:hypothetical protein GH714_008031 [Hevea brasiliensis]|uniref:Uncharacterized protein n=1 Tax=Hevea brasiliensis TaxID=3981 RepID=A0A6A6LWD9_HEVBR|nr:hypothetical protein GH714_008031 [Hevea brasiliensis]